MKFKAAGHAAAAAGGGGLRCLHETVRRASMANIPGPATAKELATVMEAEEFDQYAVYAKLHAEYGDVMYQPAESYGVDIVTLFHPRDIERVIRNEGAFPQGLGQALLPFTRFYQDHAQMAQSWEDQWRGLKLSGAAWKADDATGCCKIVFA